MAITARVAVLALTCGLSSLVPPATRAEWLPNGTPVAVLTGEHYFPRVASDGSAGAFVSWLQYATAYTQRLTGEGDYAQAWPAAGRIVPPGASMASHALVQPAAMAPDGEGGVYVVTWDQGPWCGVSCWIEPVQLFVQRLTPAGVPAPMWPSGGVRVESQWLHHTYSTQHAVAVVPDGEGGLLMTWTARSEHAPVILTVVAQSVGPDGTRRWGDDGIDVSPASGTQSGPVIVPDDKGGAFVFWGDLRSSDAGARIFGQHVSAGGERLWQAGGLPISQSPFVRLGDVFAVPDRGHGAIVAWAGSNGSDLDLYAARVTHGGHLPWREDVRICSAPGDQNAIRMVPLRNGAIAAWLDARPAIGSAVYAQRVTHAGRTEWTPNGAPVCTAPGSRGPLVSVSDGGDGAYVAWGDSRSEGELYATRMTGEGMPASGWPVDGALVCERLPTGYPHALGIGLDMTSVRDGRAILVWDDLRLIPGVNSGVGIEFTYATLLTPSGPAAPPHSVDPEPARPVSRPETSMRTVFALCGAWPNPTSSNGIIRFSLPAAGAARLELFDLVGRRLWAREVGGLGPGDHEVRLGDGSRFLPGLYLVRLVQGAHAAVARVAIVP